MMRELELQDYPIEMSRLAMSDPYRIEAYVTFLINMLALYIEDDESTEEMEYEDEYQAYSLKQLMRISSINHRKTS